MKINNKKLLISLFIMLIILSAYAFFQKSYAIATPEMDATSISLKGKGPGDTVDYTLNDLYTRYDIFCCQKGTMAFIPGQEKIVIENYGEFDVTSTTESGTVLIDETFYNDNIPSALTPGKEFTTVTNPKYVIEERKIATPKEAYILAEMTENKLYADRITSVYNIVTEGGIKVPANITDDDITKTFEVKDSNGEETIMTVYSIEVRDEDRNIVSATFYIKENGLYYQVELNSEISTTAEYGILSYVQNAWWTTAAGNVDGYNGVKNNQLATEADAFEDYILEVAGVEDTSELEYVDESYSFLDINEEEHTGTVKAAKIDYNPTWNEDANLDGVENDEVIVAWDADTQTYKVGPFSINYVKGECQTGDRVEMVFAEITDAKITTNTGNLENVTDQTVGLNPGQYRFIYKDGVERTDDSKFPNPNEVFYLEIAYLEGMTELLNIEFNFKYMNAGGEYHKMVGRGIEQTWKIINNTTYNTPCTDEDCERGHYEFYSSHYHEKYYCINNVKLKCTSSSSKELQMFAHGINGARWYNYTTLNTNKDWEFEREGTLYLEKQVVDENENPLEVSEDTNFEFKVKIKTFKEDGTFETTERDVILTVKKGQSSAKQKISTEKWKDGMQVPKYEITEIRKEGYEIKEFLLAEGDFVANETRTAKCKNVSIKDKKGSLVIKKIPIGAYLQDKTYYFNIYINDELYVEKAKVNASTAWKYTMPEYTWRGVNPTYEVVEVNKDGEKVSLKDGFVGLGTWLSGELQDGECKVPVYKINFPIPKKGKLQITKKLLDKDEKNSVEGKPFEFKISVDGHEEETIFINSGDIEERTYYWIGDTPPNYTVTEIIEDDNKEYEFVSIETSNGTADGKTVKGSLLADNGEGEEEIVYVLATNKEVDNDDESGSLIIRKDLVDKEGRPTTADKDIKVGFDVEIKQGDKTTTKKVEVVVPKGQSTGTLKEPIKLTWKKGEEAPYYKVTETKIDDDFTLVEIRNGEGPFKNDEEIEAIAINKYSAKSGKVNIVKELVDEEGNLVNAKKDETFEFDLKITQGDKTKTETLAITVKKGQSRGTLENPVEVTWKEGEETPYYKVTETKMPKGYKLVMIKNAEGFLEENKTSEAIAQNIKGDVKGNSGKLKIIKELVDKSGKPLIADKNVEVIFDLTIKQNGKTTTEEIKVIVPKGQSIAETEEFTYYWKEGEEAPYYKVSERPSSEYLLVGEIENGEGYIKDQELPIKAKAINVIEEIYKSGKVQITKKLVDKNGKPLIADEDTTVTFVLDITKNGQTTTKEIEVIVPKGQSTAKSQEFTYSWKEGEEAPYYEVKETKINGKYTLVDIKNDKGYLENKPLPIEVIATNKKDGKSGKVQITKQLIDKDGKPLIADEDTTVTFDLDITKNGQTTTEKIEVIVPKGQSTGTLKNPIEITWKEGEESPYYKVTETKINGKYTLVDIKNSEGYMKDEESPIQVIATNKVKELKGTLKIVKQVLNEELSGVLFKVKIYKNGEYYDSVEISDTKSFEKEFTWYSNENAPQFHIEEYDLPSNVKLVGYLNNPTTLQDGSEPTIITAINELVMQKGKIQIKKDLIDSKGNLIQGGPFKFKVSVEGYEDKEVFINAGETWRSDYFYWTSEEGPSYTVTEILEGDEYEFVSVTSAVGTVNGMTVSDKLENNGIRPPINYTNKTKVENEGSIKVTKKLEAEDKIDLNEVKDNFEFEVKIYYDDSNKKFEYNGEQYNSLTVKRSVSGQGTTLPINIKWYGEQAPKYNVKEVNLPNNWRFKEFVNSNSGTFVDKLEAEVICTNEQVNERKYYFTMEMGGKVWNDTNYENGKPADVEPNGIIDETEEGLSDIKVSVFKVIKDKNSKIVDRYLAGEITDSSENISKDAILYTDEAGIWKINEISVPALTEADKAKGYTKENGYSGAYDVEFTYDGQTYEPTKFLQTSNGDATKYLNATLAQRDKYLKDSMVIDNETERNEFNNRFQTISGKDPIDDDGNTIGQANSADGSSNELYYSSVDKQASTDSSTKKVSTLDLYNEKEELYDIYKMNSRTSTGGLVYPFDSKTVLKNTDTTIKFGVKTISYYYHAAYPYLNSINLGLVERKHSDLAIEKDLEQAIVVVNEKALKYSYGEIANAQFEAYPDLLYKQIQVNDKDIEYRLNLYKSDYYYKASVYNDSEVGTVLDNFYKNLGYTGKEEVELDVYLKYKITVTNESDSYVLEAKQITDYYDSDMTLVTNDVSKYIANNNGKEINAVSPIANASYSYNPDGSKKAISWNNEGKVTDSSGEEYNIISTNSLTGTKIASGESRSVYVTFKVNKAIDSTTGIENCIKLGSKYNIAEIDAYSTYYQDGRTAGKIEEDSAPGNINIEGHNDPTWYEDDTSASPVLIIGLYDVKREVNGIAWEDKESETIQYNQVVGNGIYDSGENVIPNMTTELYEKVTVDGKDYDFLWPTDSTTIPGLNGMTIEKLTGLDSTITTDSNGKYKFNGIAAGNYIVRFTYGDSNTIQYNGQDYKSTTYQAGFDNDGNDDGLIDNVWHDLSNESLANTRVSDARDNEARRLDVIRKSQTLTYDNTSVMAGAKDGLEDYYMTADTAKINMNVEKNTTGTETVGGITVNTQKGIIDTTIGAVGATNITYLVENIDFGLERRSPTNVVIDKQIEEIKLITSTGQVILDAIYDITYNGDVATVTLNAANSVGTENLQALNNTTVLQGFRYINVDEDILQGATIEIRYRFTALNSGEVDRCAESLKSITDFDSVIASEVTDNNWGNYLGKVYYSGKYAMDASGKCDDAIVETTVHKLVDYVDNDVVFSSMVNTGKDGSWTNTTTQELKDKSLIDPSIIDATENKILDEDARAYESENKNNLIMSVDNNDATQEQLTNPGFIKKLIPFNAKSDGATGEYASSMTLTVSRYYSSQSESENIDNLVEIIEMYNDVGRRDEDTIQGNAKPSLGAFKAASENDSSATEVITLTPPTGLSAKVIFMIQILSVVLSGIAIMTVGIIVIKKKVLAK